MDLNKSIGFSPANTKIQVFSGGASFVHSISDPSTLVAGAAQPFSVTFGTSISYSDGLSETGINRGGHWLDENTVIAFGFRSIWRVDVSSGPPYPAALLADLSPSIMAWKSTWPAMSRDAIIDNGWSSNDRLKWGFRLNVRTDQSGACTTCAPLAGYIFITLNSLTPPANRTLAQANYTVRRKFYNGIDSASLDTFQTSGVGTLYSSTANGYKMFQSTNGDWAVFTVDADNSRVLNISTGAIANIKTGNHGYEASTYSIYSATGGAFQIKKLDYGGAETGTTILEKSCLYLCLSGYIHGGTNDIPLIYEGPSSQSLTGFEYPFGAPEGVGTPRVYAYANRISKIVSGAISPVVYTYVGLPTTLQSDLRQHMVSPDGTLVAFQSNFGANDNSRGAVVVAKVP